MIERIVPAWTRIKARLADELLRAAPADASIEDAIARVRMRVEGEAVALEPGEYASVPTRRARIGVLERARALADGRAIVLHVHVGADETHAGRIVFDLPRRLLRAARMPSVPEPGDRFAGGRFVHAFFDEEALLEEIAAAGLRVSERRGAGAYVLVAGRDAAEDAGSFASELVRVMAAAPDVERRRIDEPPAMLVRAMRARGGRGRERGPIGRARLVRAIGWIDAMMPGGPNCYRRTLLELSLDAGAARARLVFGLDVGRTGHVAFAGREDRVFDVAYELGPEHDA